MIRHVRARRPHLVSAVVLLALVAPCPASAHLVTDPSFMAAGSTERLVLTVHNDREETMTGFRLTVPAGFRILSSGGEDGWSRAVEGSRATWTGGALPALEPVVFEVEVQATGVEPGVAELRGDQLYADGESLTWPVPLTVVPPGGEPESSLGGQAIATLSILGALVVATFGLVVWQRRRSAPRD
jgi:hypothetical protein